MISRGRCGGERREPLESPRGSGQDFRGWGYFRAGVSPRAANHRTDLDYSTCCASAQVFFRIKFAPAPKAWFCKR